MSVEMITGEALAAKHSSGLVRPFVRAAEEYDSEAIAVSICQRLK
jgi:hypothetical protein